MMWVWESINCFFFYIDDVGISVKSLFDVIVQYIESNIIQYECIYMIHKNITFITKSVHVLELYWEPVPRYFEYDPNLKIRTIPFIDLNSVKFVCDRITHISWQIEKTEWAIKTVRARDTVNIGHRRHSTKQTKQKEKSQHNIENFRRNVLEICNK